MKAFYKYLYFVFVILITNTLYAEKSCGVYLDDIYYTSLSELPDLRDIIVQVMKDPEVPHNIKDIIKTALIDEKTVVRLLTGELREKLNISVNLNAIHGSKGLSFRSFRPENVFVGGEVKSFFERIIDHKVSLFSFFKNLLRSTQNKKQQIQEITEVNPNEIARRQGNKDLIRSKHVVFVQNRPISEYYNDLLSLIHELAHVKFDFFLEKHADKLLKNFPRHLVREASDGVIEINFALLDFLKERHAVEVEFEFMLATHSKYYDGWYVKFGPGTNLSNYKDLISYYIIDLYGISDPLVLKLIDYSISDILLGKPFK